MTKQDKPHQSLNLLSLKKISAFLGIIGVITGAIVGFSTIIKQCKEKKKIDKEILMHLEVGSKFAEQFKLDKAIKEYEKVLERDEDNIKAHREIITAKRKKLMLKIGQWPTVDEILSQIYQLQALHPHLKKDTKLLVEESLLLRHERRTKAALEVMERAHKLAPSDSEVLAQLGLLRALTSSRNKVEGLDLLLKAIESQPQEARYHLYRAQALEHAQEDAESIREYYQAAKLTTSEDIQARKTHNFVINHLGDISKKFFKQDGPLISRLNMPLEEWALIYEYVINEYENLPSKSSSLEHSRNAYLATLYYELGDFKKAHRELEKMLEKYAIDYQSDVKPWKQYQHWLHWLELHIKILEKSGLAPNTFNDARKYVKAIHDELRRREEAEKSCVVLEVQDYGQPRLKVGIKYLNEESDIGVLVLHVFEKYPLDKAGVLKGDRILEIAHRQVRDFQDIKYVLLKFKQGTEIPIRVKRGDKTLLLTLLIE